MSIRSSLLNETTRFSSTKPNSRQNLQLISAWRLAHLPLPPRKSLHRWSHDPLAKSTRHYALSRISPHNLVQDIDDDRLIILSQQLQQIANESYLSQGASISTYYNLDDSKGNFTFEFQVYGRQYDNANNLIKREKTLDGRTSHWVPNIQY